MFGRNKGADKKTCLDKYGVEYSLQSELVKEKSRKTNLEKYGFDNPSKNPEVMAKMRKTLFENGNCPTSKGQKILHDIVGGILNYPCDIFNLDIFIPEIFTYIEYNGSGHNMPISRHQMTQEEFDEKEIFRYEHLRNLGLKMIEIKNKTDILPSKEIILEEIESALDLLFKNDLDYIYIDFDKINKK